MLLNGHSVNITQNIIKTYLWICEWWVLSMWHWPSGVDRYGLFCRGVVTNPWWCRLCRVAHLVGGRRATWTGIRRRPELEGEEEEGMEGIEEELEEGGLPSLQGDWTGPPPALEALKARYRAAVGARGSPSSPQHTPPSPATIATPTTTTTTTSHTSKLSYAATLVWLHPLTLDMMIFALIGLVLLGNSG